MTTRFFGTAPSTGTPTAYFPPRQFPRAFSLVRALLWVGDPMARQQPTGHPANSTKYKQQRAAFFRSFGQSGICYLCQRPVDMTLSGRHRDGRSVDHVVPVSAGGAFFALENWRLAHRSCNSVKGRSPGPFAPAAPPQDPRWCWSMGGDGWDKASPNGLDCDIPGRTCPHG